MMRQMRVILMVFVICFGLVLIMQGAARWLDTTPQLSYVSQQDGSNWHIHLMDINHRIDINLTRRLFAGNARSRIPVWSPDGKKLAFVSDALQGNHVYIYDMTTRELQQMTNEDHTYSSISWSPDGTQLAVSESLSSSMGVLLIDTTTRTIEQVTPPDMTATHVRFSPQRSLITHIYEMPAEGGVHSIDVENGREAKVIFSPPDNFFNFTPPIWSHDGRYTAFTLGNLYNQYQLCLLDIDATDIPVCETFYYTSGRLIWSPQRMQIAYPANNVIFTIADLLSPVDGMALNLQPRVIFEGHSKDQVSGLAWQPNGDYIAFHLSTQQTPESEIYITNVETGQSRRLTFNNRNDWSAAWRPAS